MITQEMHIELDLTLQKVNSQVNKNLLPQEKDWFLNNEVIKFIEQRTSKQSNTKGTGFEDTAKRVEDIKDLIRIKNLPIETNSRGKQFITLPSNYFKYIRFDSYFYKDCPSIKVKPTDTTNYTVNFNLKLPIETLTTYKIELVTTSSIVEVFNITDLPLNYLVNEEFKKQRFLLINAINIKLEDSIKEVLSPNLSLYWERRGYNFNDYTFTLDSALPYIGVKVTVNGVTTTYSASSVNSKVIPVNKTPLKSKIRVVDEEFLTDIELSHLSKSRVNSPIGVLREGVLELVKPVNAICGSVDIVYICKPNKIDLLLDSNLNLSTKVAKEIVSNTSRVLKALIDTKNYQAYAQENVLIE